MIGSAIEAYTRLLTEMHIDHAARRTFTTRLRLQDVLSYLRDKAAEEQGISAELIQNSCEARAEEIVRPVCPSCGGGDLRSRCEVCHYTGVLVHARA